MLNLGRQAYRLKKVADLVGRVSCAFPPMVGYGRPVGAFTLHPAPAPDRIPALCLTDATKETDSFLLVFLLVLFRFFANPHR